ncbi:tonB family C-terminal domain protein [Collimonas arenae]|uniref:Protein TonB n=1 Tax=Collimonas arenae TaxID=279058 RepID=A0A127QH41_9BURK|nr:energy transducer TonB [Collimonas arenae]AMO99483.1 tonB family C-terminal domain protein [Collimonas arenae]AMP09383.1 tonB family C-terminal domain protein [Collimonas arenae]
MDFTPDGHNPTRKLVGVSVVILMHVLIVYALLTGLARKVVEVIQQPVMTSIIDEIKPPPPPPPPPPKYTPPPPKTAAPPPPYVPPPEVKVQPQPQENTIAAVTSVKPASNELPTSVAQPAPAAAAQPAAGPAHTSARVAGNCEKPEYPRTSLRNEEEGTVNVRLVIGVDGRVVDAIIEKSSGFKDLDRATLKAWSLCHFTPAKADGEPVQSSVRMEYVWKLE